MNSPAGRQGTHYPWNHPTGVLTDNEPCDCGNDYMEQFEE